MTDLIIYGILIGMVLVILAVIFLIFRESRRHSRKEPTWKDYRRDKK